MPTGLKLILTEYCIREAWKHPQPKSFFFDFITKYFKKNKLDNFENVELNIIAEFHLFNLIFAKEDLNLNDLEATVLLNIFWELLKFNNMNY